MLRAAAALAVTTIFVCEASPDQLLWQTELPEQLRLRSIQAYDEVGPQQSFSQQKRVIFLVRTGGNSSRQRLDAIRSTWAKGLEDANYAAKYTVTGPDRPKVDWTASMVVIASDAECKRKYGDNHERGLTCLEAKAELELMKRTDFDWVMVIDDDVYVNVENVFKWLSRRPEGKSAVWGIPGCGECGTPNNHLTGLCGGPGYAVTRENLARMANSSGPPGKSMQQAFLKDFMTGPDAEWCDVRFSCVAQHHGLQMREAPGFYGWTFQSDDDENSAIRSTEVPPLTFHYADPPRMRRLHAKFEHFSASGESFIGIRMDVAEYARQRKAFVNSMRPATRTDGQGMYSKKRRFLSDFGRRKKWYY